MPGFLAFATQLPSNVVLRAASSADQPFLGELYASTREEEMKLATFWTDAQKRAFVLDQFMLQDQHYGAHYPNAERLVIEQDGAPVGRVLVDAGVVEVRLMDIALLPA